MSKEEPAWKAELRENLDEEFVSSGAEIFDLVVPHIFAAEQRGFQAGVNKTGDSVGKLREQLKATRAAHVSALKTDWSRYRGKVLHEVWEAMRDAEDGPLIDAMGVVSALLAQS
jgi:diketogulonate reductase-like aldo/keto reductase